METKMEGTYSESFLPTRNKGEGMYECGWCHIASREEFSETFKDKNGFIFDLRNQTDTVRDANFLALDRLV